jgi:hypothetical protein
VEAVATANRSMSVLGSRNNSISLLVLLVPFTGTEYAKRWDWSGDEILRDVTFAEVDCVTRLGLTESVAGVMSDGTRRHLQSDDSSACVDLSL